MRLAWFLASFMFGILAGSVYSVHDNPARLLLTAKYITNDHFIKEDIKMAAQYIGRFDKVLENDAALILTDTIKYLMYDADYHNMLQEVLTVVVNGMRKTWEVTLLVLPELKGDHAEYTVWSVMLGRVTTGLILGVVFVFIIDIALKDFKKPDTNYWRPLEFEPRKKGKQSHRARKRRLNKKS